MTNIAARFGSPILLFGGGLLLSLGLRASEPVVFASGPDCDATTWAGYIEVRRIEGDGAILTQEVSWDDQVSLDAALPLLVNDPPSSDREIFQLVPGDSP